MYSLREVSESEEDAESHDGPSEDIPDSFEENVRLEEFVPPFKEAVGVSQGLDCKVCGKVLGSCDKCRGREGSVDAILASVPGFEYLTKKNAEGKGL